MLKIHIVKPGDSLYEIAKKNQISLEALIAFNPKIEDPNKLEVGMKVKIPMSPKPVEPPTVEYSYKHIVKQGDSLWKLGKAWEIPLQDMIKANPQLKNPNVLLTGEVVYIPKLAKETTPENPPSPEWTPPQIAEAPPMPELYVALQHNWAPSTGNQPVNAAQTNMEVTDNVPWMMENAVNNSANHAENNFVNHVENMNHAENVNSPVNNNFAPAAVEPNSPELNQPYPQAVHPFQQVNVSATEVFAFPNPTYMEAGEGVPQAQPIPWGTNEPLGQQQPMYLPYTASSPNQQWGYSDGGCGCGSSMPANHEAAPWPAYAAYGSNVEVPPYFADPAAAASQWPQSQENSWNPSSPQELGLQHAYMPERGLIPGYYPYPNPYESPTLPSQAQIHQWGLDSLSGEENRSSETEAQTERKAVRKASKKSKPVRTLALASSNKKQKRRETKSDSNPNAPWINV
ncbi:Gamma-D-glutamyl-L-diamino acid endopeptidase 1 [compost metagenome]